MMSCFHFEWGGKKFCPPALVLCCPLQTGSWRNRERRREERREEDRQREKISIRLAASVPFSLSGAGNLPRNVTAEH